MVMSERDWKKRKRLSPWHPLWVCFSIGDPRLYVGFQRMMNFMLECATHVFHLVIKVRGLVEVYLILSSLRLIPVLVDTYLHLIIGLYSSSNMVVRGRAQRSILLLTTKDHIYHLCGLMMLRGCP